MSIVGKLLGAGGNAGRDFSRGMANMRSGVEVPGEANVRRFTKDGKRHAEVGEKTIVSERLRQSDYNQKMGERVNPAISKYGGLKREDIGNAQNRLTGIASPESYGEALGQGVAHAGGMWKAAAVEGGYGSVAKMAGSHAVRGAIGGGAVGGVTEAAQGGSFWDGASGGVMNGAIGWTGYRMAGKAVGATSANPLGKGGIVNATKQMARLHSPNISKQVTATLNQRQTAGMAYASMNRKQPPVN